MLTYTVYSEAGGVGKTTIAANLAHAHARHDRRVLFIDLDPQLGSATYLLGVDTPRDDPDADNLARHMIGRPLGSFDDLVETTPYGFDVVPSHDMVARLDELLDQAIDAGTIETRHDQLRRVLGDAGVREQYDTIIVDPPATVGAQLANALTATWNVVIPTEPTGKGEASIQGLDDIVAGLEGELADDLGRNVEIGALAVVPIGVGNTSDQQRYLETIRELGYAAPVAIRERASLFEGCWSERCTAFHYVDEHRDRKRDHEIETLDKIEHLATRLERGAGA